MSTFKRKGIPDTLLEQFQAVGRDLLLGGLISSHGGNMSVRDGDRIIITCTGCMLGRITLQDLVEAGAHLDDEVPWDASSEIAVHRAIYRHTDALAVIHAHPAHAVALSLLDNDIVPLDIEGSYFMPDVPVIGRGEKVYGGRMADSIGQSLSGHRTAIAYGHGSFAAGRDLYEALHYTTTLEISCRIITIVRQLEAKK